MLCELSPVWTVVLNLAAWLVIHLGVAWAGTRAPKRLFDPAYPLYRIRSWELNSHFYEVILGIRSWKDRLPDWGGRFRGGFFKRSLETSSPEYLQRFILETCRGEAVHWAVLSMALPFFLWNPWWAGVDHGFLRRCGEPSLHHCPAVQPVPADAAAEQDDATPRPPGLVLTDGFGSLPDG